MAEKVMSMDPGAERQGWAVIERDAKRIKSKPPEYCGMGYFGVAREVNGSKTKFEPYRLSLIEFWNEHMPILIERYEPDEFVSEIVPSVGGGNFVVATQSHLALCAITICQGIAIQHGIPVFQIGATSVKAKIGGDKKATKVRVRNGVIQIMPSLADFKKEWTKIFEVPDALAIGLAHWGYKI